ncbi:MAG: hypothetical protein QOC89_5867 [Paraburkholderia sp.]|uniref:hypothetical protein n=1 Tax=Paraburkholderia sp. TaxID=1926495 RepID=UPI002AFE77B7|nr:hypothetical protein [Paraburkholderia sp.]MEA3088170.1 hypothetical protein [Paraburkholderia sp.]
MDVIRPHVAPPAPALSANCVATQAPETRFRVRAANSTPRLVRVVALCERDDETRAAISAYGSNVQFSSASELAALLGIDIGNGGMRRPDRPRDLNTPSGAIATSPGAPDLAIIVGREGDDATAAALAAQTWRRLGVTVSAVLRPACAPAAGTGNAKAIRRTHTADLLRPWCTMVVLASSSDYLGDLLDALGAS